MLLTSVARVSNAGAAAVAVCATARSFDRWRTDRPTKRVLAVFCFVRVRL